MAGARKLQKEIEVTLKKVQEGVEEFDEIWKKVYEADNQAHKEKYEADLKKEIKKLQRLRDQIKTWIGGNEIKDKTELINARKAVEREMERFKVCEREMKTKAFSKEGLQKANNDPKERERNEVRDWVNNTVNNITVQLESYESELEGLMANNKKKSKPPPRATLLEDFISRHKQHLLRLEQTLRLVDNLVIEPSELETVKEWVDDYVERSEEAPDDFADVDSCYEDIMEQLETAVEVVAAAVPVVPKKDVKEAPPVKPPKTHVPKLPAVTEDEEGSPGEKKKSPTTPVAAKTAVAATKAKEDRSASNTPRAEPVAAPVAAPAAGATPAREPPRPAVATATVMAPPTAAARAGSPNWSTVAGQDAHAFPQLGGKADTSKKTFGAAVAAQPQPAPDTRNGAAPAPPAAPAHKPAFNQAVAAGLPQQPPPQQPPPQQPPPQQQQRAPAAAPVAPPAAAAPPAPPAAPQSDLEARFAEAASGAFLNFGVEDSVSAAQSPWGTPVQNLQLLNACASRSIPQPQDTAWNRYPTRVVPPPVPIPASYPTAKLPVLESPGLFSKVDPEVLFFAFYYQPGTYQQYLAAHQLKSQGWRYHKLHRAWLSRNDDPAKAGDKGGDNGTYVYFDYNFVHDDNTAGWCYRIKPDFVFDQDALENELA